jgi:hypothetical protein
LLLLQIKKLLVSDVCDYWLLLWILVGVLSGVAYPSGIVTRAGAGIVNFNTFVCMDIY